ncbi:hypothetical protein Anapl_09684 [Anas platyrhynchos]|uniref:Uncharacterized protein n=1 Tax=Anas platyrhynchos TaxID=8839 RepID=R0LZT3_ANAPL|nr:hypothetical protein Anapl_09684 [Anas platyrhynchos]
MAIIATGLTLRIFQACYVSAFLPAQRASTGQGVTEAVLLRFIGLSKQAKKRNQSLSPGDKLILHQSLPAHCPETEGCLNVCSFHHHCLTNHHLPDSLPHIQQREEPFYSSPGRQSTCKWQWDARFLLSQHASHYHHDFFSSKELASLLVQQALRTDGQLKHFIPHLYKRVAGSSWALQLPIAQQQRETYKPLVKDRICSTPCSTLAARLSVPARCKGKAPKLWLIPLHFIPRPSPICKEPPAAQLPPGPAVAVVAFPVCDSGITYGKGGVPRSLLLPLRCRWLAEGQQRVSVVGHNEQSAPWAVQETQQKFMIHTGTCPDFSDFLKSEGVSEQQPLASSLTLLLEQIHLPCASLPAKASASSLSDKRSKCVLRCRTADVCEMCRAVSLTKREAVFAHNPYSQYTRHHQSVFLSVIAGSRGGKSPQETSEKCKSRHLEKNKTVIKNGEDTFEFNLHSEERGGIQPGMGKQFRARHARPQEDLTRDLGPRDAVTTDVLGRTAPRVPEAITEPLCPWGARRPAPPAAGCSSAGGLRYCIYVTGSTPSCLFGILLCGREGGELNPKHETPVQQRLEWEEQRTIHTSTDGRCSSFLQMATGSWRSPSPVLLEELADALQQRKCLRPPWREACALSPTAHVALAASELFAGGNSEPPAGWRHRHRQPWHSAPLFHKLLGHFQATRASNIGVVWPFTPEKPCHITGITNVKRDWMLRNSSSSILHSVSLQGGHGAAQQRQKHTDQKSSHDTQKSGQETKVQPQWPSVLVCAAHQLLLVKHRRDSKVYAPNRPQTAEPGFPSSSRAGLAQLHRELDRNTTSHQRGAAAAPSLTRLMTIARPSNSGVVWPFTPEKPCHVTGITNVKRDWMLRNSSSSILHSVSLQGGHGAAQQRQKVAAQSDREKLLERKRRGTKRRAAPMQLTVALLAGPFVDQGPHHISEYSQI